MKFIFILVCLRFLRRGWLRGQADKCKIQQKLVRKSWKSYRLRLIQPVSVDLLDFIWTKQLIKVENSCCKARDNKFWPKRWYELFLKSAILLVQNKNVDFLRWLWTLVVAILDDLGTKKCWSLARMDVFYDPNYPKNWDFEFHFCQFLNGFVHSATVCGTNSILFVTLWWFLIAFSPKWICVKISISFKFFDLQWRQRRTVRLWSNFLSKRKSPIILDGILRYGIRLKGICVISLSSRVAQ